jgi:hypothetical protein
MIERRFISRASFRAGDSDATPTITGYAAKFNVLSSDLGGFREKIANGAFSKSLASGQDVKMLRDHNPSALLGRVKNGTLRLREDNVGLHFSCLLPDTSEGRDVYALVKRGDLGDCSFAFQVEDEDWGDEADPDDRSQRCKVRTLRGVRLLDCSLCTNPAYPETSVEVSGLSPLVMGRSARDLFPEGIPVEIRSHVIGTALNPRAQEARRRLFSMFVG